MTVTMSERWDLVRDALPTARLVAWDGCHKIYLAMDDEQADWFRGSGYTCLVEASPEEMFDAVVEWFEDSCGLRFVSAVRTTVPDPNEGYDDLIPQFADEDEDEE